MDHKPHGRPHGRAGASNQTWVADLEVSIAGAASVNDVDLFVTDPAGRAVGSATGSTNQEAVTAAGPLHLGDYVVEVRGCSGAGTVAVSGHAVVRWIPSTDELLADAPAGA